MFRLLIFSFSLILFSLSSCVSHQELINFRSGKEKEPTLSKLPKQDITTQKDIKLQQNDILAIIIMSPDGVLSTPYNLVPTISSAQVSTPTSPSTFLIGSDGIINLPTLGAFKAAGLTIKELHEEVVKNLGKLKESIFPLFGGV